MIAIAFLTLLVICCLLIIIATLYRCPKCRGWHNSQEEEDQCQQDN